MVFSEASLENLIQGFSCIDGFVFASLTKPANIHDSIVVHVPWDAVALSPRYPLSSRTVEEYVEFINLHGIRKAIVIAENIDFLLRCPTLEFLQIIPAYGAPDHFDFSPLYHMPCVKWLRCKTVYGMREEKHGDIDYAQIRGLRCLYVSETKHELHFNQVHGLQSLNLRNYRGSDLSGAFCSTEMDWLSLLECKMVSLDGLSMAKGLKAISLSYNRNLVDISALTTVRDSLFQLCIDRCPRITDFSVLAALSKLEFLELKGNNTLPNLTFLRSMQKLKVLNFSMNVGDGDLTLCRSIPYATCKNRRHFNQKDADLPKQPCLNLDTHGVALWRRC